MINLLVITHKDSKDFELSNLKSRCWFSLDTEYMSQVFFFHLLLPKNMAPYSSAACI